MRVRVPVSFAPVPFGAAGSAAPFAQFAAPFIEASMSIGRTTIRRRTVRRSSHRTPVEGMSHRRERGQSLVELALVLPILLLLVFAGIGVLQVLLTHYTVEQAARAAAHQAAIDGDWSTQARTTAGMVLDGAPWTRGGTRTVSGTCGGGACRRYSAITVTVSYRDRLWVPLPFMGDVRATAQAVRAAEQDRGTSGSVPPPSGGPPTAPMNGHTAAGGGAWPRAASHLCPSARRATPGSCALRTCRRLPMTRRTAGQSLVLVALMLPFLAALVLTAMEIGARTWQRAQLEDALRQANRAAVQTWLYPAFASGTLSVRPVDVMESGARYFETNLASITTLALPPAKTAAAAQWTPVIPADGGTCTDPAGRVVTLARPGMCATVTVTLRSVVGWQSWTTTVFAADTVDIVDATP